MAFAHPALIQLFVQAAKQIHSGAGWFNRAREFPSTRHAELPIAIRVNGRYHDVGSFAADVANLSRIVTLHNLVLTTGKDPGGNLVMDATARTYRYLDLNELAEVRKARADAAKASGARK